MKKILTVALLCFFTALVLLSSCTSKKVQQPKILHQNITSLSHLKEPDKIFYYHDGRVNVYTKDDPKFKRILELNVQRDQGKLNVLKEDAIMDFEHGHTLEYNYGKSGYERIYFPLDKPSDGNYRVDQMDPSAFAAEVNGFLSAPDQLLNYLNS